MSTQPPSTDRSDGGIAPIAFQPLATEHKPRPRVIRIAAIASAALLGACLVILWFVFTARSLTVQTSPPEATVNLSGGLAVKLGNRYLLRSGEYRIEVQAPGYHSRQQTLSIADDASPRLVVELEKLPGLLAVNTVPEGARILLDKRDRGQTPQTLADIPPGDYSLQLNHPRYQPWQQDISIQGMAITDRVDAQLQPAWGLIALQSTPSGAEVTVGDQLVGTTPLDIQVLASGEPVTIKLQGHKRWEKILHGTIGETLSHEPVILAPADGLATVSSSPAGATVTVNNEYKGRTPVELELEPDKTHTIGLILDGYHSEERKLTLAAGQEETVDIALRANTGTIKVSVSPAGASLYVDGKLHSGDGTLVLPARPHRIEARLRGHTSQSRTITPRPGIEQAVSLVLQAEGSGKTAEAAGQITTPAGQELKLFRPDTTFTMGSSRREQGRRANEIQRQVSLSRPFYLATTEVTNAQYKKFQLTHSSSHFSRNTLDLPDQPVVRLSWLDAARYCNWLSEQSGLTPFYTISGNRVTAIDSKANGYRLPTEAEWEWAARVEADGTLKKYPWGDSFPPVANVANYADQSAAAVLGRILTGYQDGHIVSAPVKKFSPNGKGLYGLGHNVAEWVHDFYGIEPTLGSASLKDPTGPASGEFRVIRGASWRHGSITELRLSFRDYGSDPRDDVGFRIARYVD